jgi:hypothetical protein
LHPLAGQCQADRPVSTSEFDLAIAVQLQHPRAFRTLPLGRPRIIAPRLGYQREAGVAMASASSGRRWLCSQRYSSSQPCRSPGARDTPRLAAAAVTRRGALHLALRPRMPYPAEVQFYALPISHKASFILDSTEIQGRTPGLRSGPIWGCGGLPVGSHG